MAKKKKHNLDSLGRRLLTPGITEGPPSPEIQLLIAEIQRLRPRVKSREERDERMALSRRQGRRTDSKRSAVWDVAKSSKHLPQRRSLKNLDNWKKEHLTALRKCRWSRKKINAAQEYLDRSFTDKERGILEELTEGLQKRSKWHDWAYDKMPRIATDEERADLEKDRRRFLERDQILSEKNREAITFNGIAKDYEKNIRRAVRVGLRDHPLVREWIQVYRSLGDWDFLRKAKVRLERGVKRMDRPKEVNQKKTNDKLRKAIIECYKTADRKKPSREYIKRMLMDQGKLLPTFSRQRFHKMLTRFDLQNLFS